MKNLYKIVLTTIGLLASQLSFAQWTDVINNNIHFRFAVQDNHYTGANDADGQCDPTIRNDFWISANGGSWTGWECYTWDCVAPCYNYNNPIVHSFYDKPFNTEIQITAEMFESDNSNECQYTVNGTDNDDNHWNGNCTFRNGSIQMPVVYANTDFYPGAWNPYLGQGGSGWIFPNAPYFNQIWKQVWRYVYGNSNGALLNFGTIAIGQSKRDVNSNRTVLPNDGLMWYTHTSESVNPSPDVWYEFTLAEPAIVSITTTSGHTNFDTYIRLFDGNDNFIEDDYDDGGNLTSLITRKLCAGNYKFLVEGWQNNTGVFEVTVSAAEPGNLSSNHQITGESCPGEANGSVIISGFNGGVTPYTFNWNNETSTTLSFYGLEEGMYPLFITDACGTTTTETIVVPDGDETPAVALCVSDLTVNVSQGTDATITFEQIDNGSYDNCGFLGTNISPDIFTVADVGLNTVTLTVVDGNDAGSQCTTQVTVVNTTGVVEAQLLNNMTVYPNPNSGMFRVDLTNAELTTYATLNVLDNLGRVIYTSNATQSIIDLDISNIPAGVYLVQVDNDGVLASKRVMVLK